MLIVMRAGATAAQLEDVREEVEGSGGTRTYVVRDDVRAVIGCVGDADALAEHLVESLPGVESVTHWRTPYRLASRQLAPPGGRTVVRIGDGPGASVGGRALLVIAGPCSVEGREMLLETACGVRRAGAAALRGGAFKPRTSPYAFQGLGRDALRWLTEVRRETGLPVVTEVLDPRHAGGRADLVAPLAFAAIAAGADGLIVEVHPRPATARSDGDQSLSLTGFAELMRGLAPFAAAAGRTLAAPPRGASSRARGLKARHGPTRVLKDPSALEAV